MTSSCVGACDSGFELMNDLFCSSNCMDYYDGVCYECNSGYYSAIKAAGSSANYVCLT